jgi:competence protein ComEA
MLFVAGQYKPKKIDVNSLGYQELRTHPYIQHHVAMALLAYRNAHGRFSSIDDVYNIISVGRKKAERLSPYLTFND